MNTLIAATIQPGLATLTMPAASTFLPRCTEADPAVAPPVAPPITEPDVAPDRVTPTAPVTEPEPGEDCPGHPDTSCPVRTPRRSS